jgi:hypothetical protein
VCQRNVTWRSSVDSSGSGCRRVPGSREHKNKPLYLVKDGRISWLAHPPLDSQKEFWFMEWAQMILYMGSQRRNVTSVVLVIAATQVRHLVRVSSDACWSTHESCLFDPYLLRFCIWRWDDYKRRISFFIICSSLLDASISRPDYNRFYTWPLLMGNT